MFSHVSSDINPDLAVDDSSSRPSENRMKSDIIGLVQILENCGTLWGENLVHHILSVKGVDIELASSIAFSSLFPILATWELSQLCFGRRSRK